MTVYRVGPFQLNAERLALTFEGRPVGLGQRVVETLLALVERAGQAVDKDALLDRVWPEGFVEESNLAQNVYVLRKTFRAHGVPDAIETVPRLGYRLTAPVDRLTDEPHVRKPAWSIWRTAATAAAVAVVAGALTFARGFTGERYAVATALPPDVQRTYLIGRYYWNLRTPDALQKSLTYFARVIDADPQSALGYAAMADANVTMGDYCWGSHRPSVYFARARSYAQKALALDPNSAEAHAALGFAELHGSNKAFGLSELRRAIALDPAYAPAHEWYGIWLARHGDPQEAAPELRIAANLEPLSVSTTQWLGFAAMQLHEPDEAATYAREAIELAPQRRFSKPPPNHPRWAELENPVHAAQHG